ncbi:MAG TPA: hypothetical protein VN088_20220 [Nocardioides sp.]|nr:hypothetical protein [Nocardioides sp.]
MSTEEGTAQSTEQTPTSQTATGQEAHVGDAPPPMARGRSENPPEDGVGYDGTPVADILRDRAERLAPEARPENSEVDNTHREFDAEKAMFTDEPGYDEAPKKFPPASEQGA